MSYARRTAAPRKRGDNGFKIRRHFMMTIDPQLATQLQNYMEGEGIQLDTEAEAVRQLMRIALASTAEIGFFNVARARAFNETKRFVIDELVQSFRNIQKVLNQSVAGVDEVSHVELVRSW